MKQWTFCNEWLKIKSCSFILCLLLCPSSPYRWLPPCTVTTWYLFCIFTYKNVLLTLGLIIWKITYKWWLRFSLVRLLSLWRDVQTSWQSKFWCNIFISLFLTLWETLNNFFQVSWWPLDCVWKWYRNHISNVLFWIAWGVLLSGKTFFFSTKWSKNLVKFSNKTKIRTITYLVRYYYFQTTFCHSKCLDCKSHDLLIRIKQFF